LNEKELIALLIQQNEAAFKQLVEDYQNKVYNTCLGIIQNASDAEETAQDVFLEVYDSIAKFDQKSTMSTWIYRISINKSLDKLRFLKRKKRFGIMHRLFQNGNSDAVFNKPDFVHPGVQLEQKELSVILFKAIDELPDKQKTAYVLHNIEGVSYQEIAVIMETSLSSVESLLFRAKENLKKLLNDHYQKNYK